MSASIDFNYGIQIGNSAFSDTVIAALDLHRSNVKQFHRTVLDIIIRYSHSQSRTIKAMNSLEDIKLASGTVAKEKQVCNLVNFLSNNRGSLTMAAVDLENQENLDSVETFAECFGLTLDPSTNIMDMFADIANNACEEDGDNEELCETYVKLMENDKFSDSEKVVFIKGFIINLLTDDVENVENDSNVTDANITKCRNAVVDPNAFDKYASVTINDTQIAICKEDKCPVLEQFSDKIDDSFVKNLGTFCASYKEDEEEQVKEGEIEVEEPEFRLEPKNVKSKKSTSRVSASATRKAAFEIDNTITNTNKKGKYPDRMEGESDDAWCNRMTSQQEKSMRWNDGLHGDPLCETHREKYAETMAKIMKDRTARIGNDKGKTATKKVTPSPSEKRVKDIPFEEKQDGDDVAGYISNISCSGASEKALFVTESGFITYPLRAGNKNVNFNIIVNNLKSAFGLTPNVLRFYRTKELPVYDKNNEKSNKEGWYMKEDEGGIMAVTDIVYKNVTVLHYAKDEKNLFEVLYSKLGLDECSQIMFDLYKIILFRWYTRCNEDFYSIVIHKGAIVGINESTVSTETGNNSRKDITKSITSLAKYKTFLENEKNMAIVDAEESEDKKNLMKRVQSLIDAYQPPKLVSRMTKKPNGQEELNNHYYQFILRRMENAELIWKCQTW